MALRKTGKTFVVFMFGVSITLMISSQILQSGRQLAGLVLLGSGVVSLLVTLAIVQLRMWREGDMRKDRAGEGTRPSRSRPAPPELASPRLRRIWEQMQETRTLMDLKQERACQIENDKEKIRLGLPKEEEILFIVESSVFPTWPIALVSLCFLLASALISDARISSFLFLIIGLGGLVFLASINGWTKYYFTNFRVLARRRSILRGKSQWSATRYLDVHKCSLHSAFCSKFELEGVGGKHVITGLTRAELQTIAKISLPRLPPNVLLNATAGEKSEQDILARACSER